MSSQEPQPIHPAPLHDTLGVLFLSVVAGSVLYGLTFFQTWYYYREYPKDRWQLKLLVSVVWLLETVHEAFISHAVYWMLVVQYDHPESLNYVPWSIIVFVNGLLALIVQSFFIYRIYHLGGRRIYLPIFVTALAIGQLVVTMVYTGRAYFYHLYSLSSKVEGWSIAITSSMVLTDLVIAVCMSHLLLSFRTGFQRSDSMIIRMVYFAVTTGLLTSVDSICTLITFLACPNFKSFVYMSFFFALGRIYANSLLATLNARRFILTAESDSCPIGGTLESVRFATYRSSNYGARRASRFTGDYVDVLSLQVLGNKPRKERG
ncbi:hypothetical protein BV25DRAFT_1205103 [Artomyces pyxidatus]|uniref:Uncharacterized protein n=1 Tax=Artomyces pyxidatus TaxID=48021 RepID=A0ACB8SRG8_9AGAM|nr:hypothetical protein BV25DRAFT_1205103 [Artomyces pyxidatus]